MECDPCAKQRQMKHQGLGESHNRKRVQPNNIIMAKTRMVVTAAGSLSPYAKGSRILEELFPTNSNQ